MPTRRNKAAVLRFIGMVNYLSPFCEHLSSIIKPLRILDMDLTSGVAIHDVKATLASFRSDQQFEILHAEANSFAEKCGSEVLDGSFSDSDPTTLQNKRYQTLPAHLADDATDQKVNQRYSVLNVNSTFPS